MPNKVKVYILIVIAAGCLVFGASLRDVSIQEPGVSLAYVGLAVFASVWKVRLPRITGTYSLNFLFLLAGIFRFPLVVVLVAACAAAMTQSLWGAKQRPTVGQIAFNMANLSISVGVCFLVAHGPLVRGLVSYRPAVLAMIAFLYFVINTVLVSGVLSLLQGKALGEIWQDFYFWYLVYYLIGAALVGALPVPGWRLHPEAGLLLVPLLYLIHFYYGVADGNGQTKEGDAAGAARFGSTVYLAAVIGAGAILFATALLRWQPGDTRRFAVYLLVAILGSVCKVRLPGMTGTLSMGFVMLLVGIAELSFGEAILASAILPLVQSLWRPEHRPKAIQVYFSMASLVISTAAAYAVCRWVQPGIPDSLPAVLALAMIILYSANTLLIAGVLRLVERRPLGEAWMRCYFWSFPYYAVGTAAAGLVIFTSRQSGWQPSLLVLPLLLLVHISYRLQVDRAAAQQAA